MIPSENAQTPGPNGAGGLRQCPTPTSPIVRRCDDFGHDQHGYTVADAHQLVACLRRPVVERETCRPGPVGDPIQTTARYCCTAVGLEQLQVRAAATDPRCPCARAYGWHVELAEVAS